MRIFAVVDDAVAAAFRVQIFVAGRAHCPVKRKQDTRKEFVVVVAAVVVVGDT